MSTLKRLICVARKLSGFVVMSFAACLILFLINWAYTIYKYPGDIKPKPWAWQYVWLLSVDANAIYPYVYLPRDQFEDYSSDMPSLEVRAVILHERFHIKEQKRMGITRFAYLYITSSSFRLRQELYAIRVQMIELKAGGGTFDIERRARQLSGREYFWAISYKEILRILNELWDGV